MQIATAITWSTRFSARRDLRVQANADGKLAAYYNVLDPITRHSYRVGELERSVLSALNGKRTLAQVLKLLRKEQQFKLLSEQQLLLTVEQLQRTGLVRASQVAPGLGRVTRRASDQANARQSDAARAQAWLSGFVSWQLRGLQPDAWLARIAPYTNAIFSSKAVIVWLVIAAVTGCGVLLEFPRLAIQSTAWQWIVHPVQGSALFAVFIITRAVHELGHAVVCKRHGVRCPDIGLFVVLGAPCVYCDVSESWQLPNRWQRAAVAAAGMYVELIVATLAAWVWMLTIDGPVNIVALQTMFVCSVSTLLINANPLMRFDGYYILSDILDESNLRGRADTLAETRLYRWILGRRALPLSEAAKSVYGHLLCVFSWMGWCYRAGLSLAIAGLLVTIYDSWNIAWVGRTIAVLILISWWGIPGVKLAKNLIQMAEKTKRRWRLTLVTTVFVLLVSLMPMPYRQFGSGWVQPESMRGVYAPATGVLEHFDDMPATGSFVEEGDELFYIHDIEAKQDVIRAEGMAACAQEEFESHRQAQSTDTDTYKSTKINADERLQEAQEELKKRMLKSPGRGRYIVLPATPPSGPWNASAASLQYTGSLQYTWDNPTQVGRLIPKGTMVATVCGSQMVAVIPLNDSQLEWVYSGTEVRLRCIERDNEVYRCKVDKVVALDDISATWRLMNGDLVEASSSGVAGSSSVAASSSAVTSGTKRGAAVYAAQVVLPTDVVSSVGARIDGVFVAPSQTIGSICYRWMRQNLRWLAD